MWLWESDAFGNGATNEDVDGDGRTVKFPLRFPGQYYDKETGLHYNWHRYYDPTIGRYIISDPTGLDGGMNTYAYVDSNPLMYIDPLGLASISFDLYWGKGGGITIGYNEKTGRFFGGGRLGFGFGGGFSIDFLDQGPADEACSNGGAGGTKIGTFGGIGGNVGPYSGTLGFQGGCCLDGTGDNFTKPPSLHGTINGDGGVLSIGGAVGIQVIGF